MNIMAKLEQLIDDVIEEYDLLIEANFKTGLWDSKRNTMRKKYDDYWWNISPDSAPIDFNIQDFIDTERQSRKYCELRAVHRKNIDRIIQELIKIYVKN